MVWLSTMQSLSAQPSKSGVPRKLAAQIQVQDSNGATHRISHPGHGRSFQIPLRPELDASDGLWFELRVPNGDASAWTLELEEARRELESQHVEHQKIEEDMLKRERNAAELEIHVSQLPTHQMVADLEGRLLQEATQRRRCQADLLDMRARPGSFCFIQGADDANMSGCAGVARRSRTEVSVPSCDQSFDFDFIAEPNIGIEEAWAEVVPMLDLALHHPASHACVFFCGQIGDPTNPIYATELSRFQHALITRMVDHIFEPNPEVNGGMQHPRVQVVASAGSLGQESCSFYDLLQNTETAVQDLCVQTPEASAEVLAAFDKGLAHCGCDFTVVSLCADRVDLRTQEPLNAARLSIVNIKSLPDNSHGHGAANDSVKDQTLASSRRLLASYPGIAVDGTILANPPSGATFEPESLPMATATSTGSSTTGGSSPNVSDSSGDAKRHVAAVAKAAQAALERACEGCHCGNSVGQAKSLVVACVSQQSSKVPDSLAALQIAAATSSLQERVAPKAEESQCRRQLGRALQENARLRAELQERGRAVQSLASPTADGCIAEGEACEALLDEAASPSVRRGCSGRSPRRATASTPQSCNSEKRSKAVAFKENCMPENFRRAFSATAPPAR